MLDIDELFTVGEVFHFLLDNPIHRLDLGFLVAELAGGRHAGNLPRGSGTEGADIPVQLAALGEEVGIDGLMIFDWGR